MTKSFFTYFLLHVLGQITQQVKNLNENPRPVSTSVNILRVNHSQYCLSVLGFHFPRHWENCFYYALLSLLLVERLNFLNDWKVWKVNFKTWKWKFSFRVLLWKPKIWKNLRTQITTKEALFKSHFALKIYTRSVLFLVHVFEHYTDN